ncbi:EcsC protein family protein [Nocardioides dokdonensis FR1436]|uniref:EcsC protein family protein n=1 Tax=Nocardioides dokdonensis FR1436 TaxID=1300347 RepID=A0A1A9GL18_9ACTN|nr:EcsC family protein [Nocardioides dokdonensis]ANH38352.1 EcsC protein family protein [Nocardioides dokdonensis FR1436]
MQDPTTEGQPSGTAVGKATAKAAGQLQKLTLSAVDKGVGPMSGSRSYAAERLRHAHEDVDKAVTRVVRESVVAAGTAGFVTGLGGLITLPVSLPASITGSLIINARMVGSIAHLRGHDLDDPHVQAMLMLTVAGSSAQSIASEMGVKLGKQAALQAIDKIPMQVIRAVNQRAGVYLVAKYGTQRSMITLSKAVPGVGGLVGGGVDAALTRGIGGVAKRAFPPVAPGLYLHRG